MWKWIFRLALIAILGVVGVAAYESYRDGYFDLPPFGQDSYAISFQNGLRGIVVDAEVSNPMASNSRFFRRLLVADPERIYLGLPLDVPVWFEDTWSFCKAPTDDDRRWVDSTMPDVLKQDVATARFDAVCRIDVEGQQLVRGLIYSVPRL